MTNIIVKAAVLAEFYTTALRCYLLIVSFHNRQVVYDSVECAGIKPAHFISPYL